MLLTVLLLTLGSCSAYPQLATENYGCTAEQKGTTRLSESGSLLLSCNGSLFLPKECQINNLYVEVSEVEKAMRCNKMVNDWLTKKCSHECPFKNAMCHCDTISKAFEHHQHDNGLFSYTLEKVLHLKEKSKKMAYHAYKQLAGLIKQETCEAGLKENNNRTHTTNYCVLSNHQCINMTHFNKALKTCNPATHKLLHGQNDKESCEKISKMFDKHNKDSLALHTVYRTLHFQTCSYENNSQVHHALKFLTPSTASVANTVEESVSSSEEFFHFSLNYTKKNGDVVAKNRCAAKNAFRSTVDNNQYLKGFLNFFGKCSFEEQNGDECVRKSVENAYTIHRDHFSTYFIEKVLGLKACPVKSVGQPEDGHVQRFEQMDPKCTPAASDDDVDTKESSAKCFVEYSTADGSDKIVSVSEDALNSVTRCNDYLARFLGGSTDNLSERCQKIKDMYARHGGAAQFEDLFNRLIGAEDVTESFRKQDQHSQHALEWTQSYVDQSSCTVDETEQSAQEGYECELDGRLQSNFFGNTSLRLKTSNMAKTLACNQKLSETLTKECPNKDKDCVCNKVQNMYNMHRNDFALSLFHRILNLKPCTEVEQYANLKQFEHTLDWVRTTVQKSCNGEEH